jgi:UDP-2-acetamido-2-deoxy-ribo-hexuluronate aminotransferase
VGALPIAERLHREVVSLPMHPYLTDEEIDYVCAAMRDFCSA